MTVARRTLGGWYVRIAAIVLGLVLVVAVLGGALAPHDPIAGGNHIFAPFGTSGHLLGTDYNGRDVLSRLLSGAFASVVDAFAMVGVGLVLGAVPGVLSAFTGRWVEFLLSRSTDALLTLPPVIFAIAVAGLFTNGELAAILAVGVLLAPRFFRVARAEALGFANQQYVEAAMLLGASRWWIVRRHVARKVVPAIAITTATSAGYAVLTAASLGFLGIGVTAPNPTWGGMLADDVQHLADDSIAPIWPGLALALTVWALNALADGLRTGLAVESGRSRHPATGPAVGVDATPAGGPTAAVPESRPVEPSRAA